MPNVTDEAIERIGNSLRDVKRPLKDRFRALFTLRNLSTDKCIDEIIKSFGDSSALLKHELAYCLGQMRNCKAVSFLSTVLENDKEETIVRHEAGEALGAIGATSALPLLQKYSQHPIPEIAETCQLAVERIKWLEKKEEEGANQFKSVDPAPPMKTECSVEELSQTLLNEKLSLFERYRAMFTLRDRGSEEDILALCKGLKCASALFRHEIAFVLGQVAHPASTDALRISLENTQEQPMVRHECAEALGAIATDECFKILEKHVRDDERVVRESCDVALDMCEYGNSDQFQYADGLTK